MEYLSADTLYLISLELAGKDVDIEEKVVNAKQILRLCEVNKRFNQLYCKNDRIWKELWLRDIKSSFFPLKHIKSYYGEISMKDLYLKALNKLKKSHRERLTDSTIFGYDIPVRNIVDKGVPNYILDEILEIAIINGHLDIIQYLQSKGANIHFGNDKALLLASSGGNLSLLLYLIDQGLDIENKKDETLLWASGGWDTIPIINYLLDIGADVHYNNEEPLKRAIKENKMDIANILVEHGAFIDNIPDKYVLNYYAFSGDLDMVKELIENGTNSSGLKKKAIYNAAKNKHWKIARYLIKNGGKINIGDKRQILYYPISDGNLGIFKYFSETIAPINNADEELLLRAIYLGEREIAQYILSQGVQIPKEASEKIDKETLTWL